MPSAISCRDSDKPFFTVARVGDLPPDGRLEVTLHDRHIVLFNTSGGLFAIAAECPHRGGPLAAGCVEKESVYCPLHGWEFNLRTGKCVGREEKTIARYDVIVVGEEIRIRLDI